MTTYDFTSDWCVGPQISPFARLTTSPDVRQVTLPHDALISEPRSASHQGKTAFFPSGAYQYTKTFDVPAEWRDKAVWVCFDGVYRDAMVFVNDALAAHRANGYAPFDVAASPFLKYGQPNTLKVEARTHDDSRWYPGAGIYREVTLDVRELLHIEPGGVHVRTPDVDDERAVVIVTTPVVNRTNETRTVRARVVVRDAKGAEVAHADDPVTVLAGATATVRSRLYVDQPQRWSVEDPYLYEVAVSLTDGESDVDEERLVLGIRTLRLDPRHGLRVNGQSVKLRGTCLHHDNGPLGSAAYADAETRKIRKLKEAGFNAVRSAHHMMSTAMLRACDRLGMIVMDEVYDAWTVQKASFDSTISFADAWAEDVTTMVRRDRNHPSVVFYSIGNEIPETGNPHGARISRAMVDKIREHDADRFTTNGINGFVSVLDDVLKLMAGGAFGEAGQAAVEGPSAQGGVNDAMSAAADGMSQLNRSELVTARTEEAFATLDVAGMNYGDARYIEDAERFPRRVIVGTETYPGRIATNWPLVLDLPHVIGDFTWTGWDYLGEVGIGRPRWVGEDLALEAGYPWLTAWCGDIDITGWRRPASYFREIVFGLRTDPCLAVHNPATRGTRRQTGTWSWSDTQSTWTWDVPDGTPMTVEVYSGGDEVELFVGDASLGRRPAGAGAGFLAEYELDFTSSAGLTAVTYADGAEIGRATLAPRSGEPVLRVLPEQVEVTCGPGALAYVPVEIHDMAGTLLTDTDRSVSVQVDGPAELLALGSGRPDNEEAFGRSSHHTFRGRLLAVVRPTGPGTVRVTATTAELTTAEAEIRVRPVDGAAEQR